MAYTWLPGKVASIKTYTYYARRNYQCSQVKYRQNQDNIVQHQMYKNNHQNYSVELKYRRNVNYETSFKERTK